MTAIMAIAGCASGGPQLSIGGNLQTGETGETGAAGVTLPNTIAHQPYSLGGWVMCLDRPGAVRIEKAELIHPDGDIRLAAFSSRLQSADHPMLGNANEPLTSLGFPAQSPAVTRTCSRPGEDPGQGWPRTELGLQYTKDSDATARAEGIRLIYISAGERRTVDFFLSVELCAPNDVTTPNCKEMYEKLNASR
ncbi:hypothetical protein [Microtetraspora sp. NBRC 16547]|uniref:hypothetical protein n=1 Tax=Microtetraspora sp. NBRC 16547 TaxID=3030993 RepID=UPI002557892F|nr:hypothetical protein [Microtetraspora sp. NBRC 16547]